MTLVAASWNIPRSACLKRLLDRLKGWKVRLVMPYLELGDDVAYSADASAQRDDECKYAQEVQQDPPSWPPWILVAYKTDLSWEENLNHKILLTSPGVWNFSNIHVAYDRHGGESLMPCIALCVYAVCADYLEKPPCVHTIIQTRWVTSVHSWPDQKIKL